MFREDNCPFPAAELPLTVSDPLLNQTYKLSPCSSLPNVVCQRKRVVNEEIDVCQQPLQKTSNLQHQSVSNTSVQPPTFATNFPSVCRNLS